ncbi:MAG TPA: hypothetical protein VLX09_15050 [Stellaceae bacterium]|nr:hypothetical protein [Stellaceae bacterium]
MTMKFCSLLVGASLLALAGTAQAGQPLTDNQMDGVTAGAAATANAAALALGDLLTFTATQTATNAVTTTKVTNPDGTTTTTPGIAFAGAFSEAAASSALFQAAVAAHSDSAATLP